MQQELEQTRAFVSEDKAGCMLFVRMYAYQGKEVAVMIQLKLPQEKRIRNLGYITLSDGMYHVKRERAKHFFHNALSYGFCDEVLRHKDLFSVQSIHVTEDSINHYIVPIHVMENFGSYLHFKEQGFERQRFLRLETLKLFKQEDYAERNAEFVITADSHGAGVGAED